MTSSSLQVTLVAKAESQITGLSRYVNSLEEGLRQVSGVQASVMTTRPPRIPAWLLRLASLLGADLKTFFASYPLHLSQPPQSIYHLTSQNLATLLVFQSLRPAVVTVHDIIPLLVLGHPELDTFQHLADRFLFRLSIAGLRRAQALIAISQYTRQTLIEALGYPAEKIHVVYRVVDTQRFNPQISPEPAFQRFNLRPGCRYILYVGSDDPRKNLACLVQAFAVIQAQFPDLYLLIAGASHFSIQRQKLKELVNQVNLPERILFLGKIPDHDLPALYKAADIFVLPSLYEGFGLPALEAMACGVPVIVANAASLPEVVGDAGLLFDPLDSAALAKCLNQVLCDPDLKKHLSLCGRERAVEFNLARQAQETVEIYHQVNRN